MTQAWTRWALGFPFVCAVKDANVFNCLTLNCHIQEFISKAITLPGEGEIMDMMKVADPDAVHAVRNFIRRELASALKDEYLSTV